MRTVMYVILLGVYSSFNLFCTPCLITSQCSLPHWPHLPPLVHHSPISFLLAAVEYDAVASHSMDCEAIVIAQDKTSPFVSMLIRDVMYGLLLLLISRYDRDAVRRILLWTQLCYICSENYVYMVLVVIYMHYYVYAYGKLVMPKVEGASKLNCDSWLLPSPTLTHRCWAASSKSIIAASLCKYICYACTIQLTYDFARKVQFCW